MMPLSRLLLPLCGLLLALSVTSATAAAALYGDGEVKITLHSTPSTTSRSGQITYCSSLGGSLVPMVTEAVYNLLTTTISNAGVTNSLSYMGASSMLSSSVCTENTETLECIWYWDEGRYAGIANAVPFYKGNRDPRILPGATMLGTSVENHWRVYSIYERCPCGYHDRYGAVLRDGTEAKPYWADATATNYKYPSSSSAFIYTLCAVEQTVTTTTTTTTTTPTNTTVAPKSSTLNLPLVIGLSVGCGAVVVLIVVLVTLMCCCGWCCFAKPDDMSTDGYKSRRGSMSRASSARSGRSRRSSRGDGANRSFHDGMSRKNGSVRYSSVRGCEDDMEMTSFANPQFMRTPSAGNMFFAPPPGAVPMPVVMPMPPQVMQNSWVAW